LEIIKIKAVFVLDEVKTFIKETVLTYLPLAALAPVAQDSF
jgi:hypothetical protein